MLVIASVASIFVLGAAAQAESTQLQQKCNIADLQRLAPANASVLNAEYISSGGGYGQGLADLSYPVNGTFLPEMCAAIINATSSPTSSYTFGIYMPFNWTNRFMQVGNGAFAGGINFLDMATASRYQMATISTDCGHNSTQTDTTWALNSPEARDDWGWRAIHESLLVGKQLTEAFYSDEIKYTYYMGASTGGRQGLRELEEFPNSYDGAIVGAPGWWTDHLQPWMTRVFPTGNVSSVSIPQQDALAIEVVKQCDSIDGVTDGIVSYPDACNLDYTPLLCGPQSALNSSVCFTEGQIATLKRTYGDYYTDTGDFVFPGYMISSEAEWYALLGPTPSPLGYGWVGDILLHDPSWNYQDYNDSIVAIADSVNPGSATANNFDLTPFRDVGGKLIMYQGLSDGGFSAHSARIFYENVAQTMGYKSQTCDLTTTEALSLQSWFKFYYIPGMQHCVGTVVNAPWYINGPNQAAVLGPDVYSVPGYEDPEHDSIMAILDWVENSKEFHTIIGTAFVNQVPNDGILRQRPLCPYPSKQVYNGTGDTNSPHGWDCVYNDGPPI